MILEHDHAITVFEETIATLNYAMHKGNDAWVYRAMTAEHAGAMNTVAEYTGKKNKELADILKKQGKNAPGKALDLSHDW